MFVSDRNNFLYFMWKMTVEQSSCRWVRLECWKTLLELVIRVEHLANKNSTNLHAIPRTFIEVAISSSHPAITATPESTQSKQILSFQVTIYFSIKYISVFDFYKNTILRYFWSHVVECTSDDVTQLKGTELIDCVVKKGWPVLRAPLWLVFGRHSLIQRFPSVTKSKPETIFKRVSLSNRAYLSLTHTSFRSINFLFNITRGLSSSDQPSGEPTSNQYSNFASISERKTILSWQRM